MEKDMINMDILNMKGKGVEYYDNYQIKFTGIFKNGKKWDGIGYSSRGKEEYILKNGEENGKRKEYNYKNGKKEFDGNIKMEKSGSEE